MTATLSPPEVDGDHTGGADELVRVLGTADEVLVRRSGTRLAPGVPARLVHALHRPHRRLVRVLCDGGPCYLARTELLTQALRHGITADELVRDAPDLDRRLAETLQIVDPHEMTRVDDPAAGRWRVWVDASALSEESPGRRLASWSRRRAGIVRREIVRLRQRS
ncbi:hypothetical protein [Janibacter anophelis]|uniref:hypothetical protein n=1 Tax=Janibacter anophelis TaxID=319054 RepID=UPI000DEF3D60|nr:hypothetical protein [Janibacter anophelis]